MTKTEQRNPKTTHFDRMTTDEMVRVMAEENFVAAKAVEKAAPEIALAVDAVTESLGKGGRLFFIGAGTSGRLGVLDAAECPPTFGVPRDTVIGIIAGGKERMFTAGESEEDNEDKGKSDLAAYDVTENDCVVGVSAAGNAAYVVGALAFARERGARTVALTCNRPCRMESVCDILIVTDTGAEVVTGSTRLKAGTAHKMVMNMLTTCAMTKLGNVYENMMINLKPSNIKLRERMINIVREIAGCDAARAEALLDAHGWNIREAVSEERE